MNGIKEYLDHEVTQGFSSLLFSYIDKSGEKDSTIYKRANVDRKLFSKIRCNLEYIPNKKTVIKLCLSLRLSKIDFDRLLSSAGYALGNTKFDTIIKYFILNNIYDIDIINDSLFSYVNAVL